MDNNLSYTLYCHEDSHDLYPGSQNFKLFTDDGDSKNTIYSHF